MEIEVKNEKFNEDLYLHVFNGGATISIEQSEYGAKITIKTSSVGNNITTQEITTNNNGILALKELFNKAGLFDFKTNDSYAIAYPLQEGNNNCVESGTN